ncbi:beta-galactosidase [Agromyces mangrovi Wang et al. 2018]|uniref:beta-galactosidase n=1 Tax=Agromyces mangrovi TaxID=1858653 RepID=UPI002573F657|nr:beta-galactosidase [Agromyces mangrovi]BDZ64090.1 beta-galactosidase [Agromyces mangrovi]
MTSFTSHSADLAGPTAFPWLADGLAYGGDYSPEQWPEEVWADDVALMQRAGVNLVNLGVFSWGLLEVADGEFDWGWLDRIMDLLHDGGIGVNLATPTAAPPTWLLQAHPEIATVDADGRRTAQGGRLAWSPSSATFRRYALRLVRAMAERYGDHPALRMWHVSNELGNENARCYGEETAAAWREWLTSRYGEVAAMNDAWGSAFWGHRYTSFAQVEPPRHNRTQHNPGLLLDFERFTSDALLGHYLAERAVLREVTPAIPVTTNFMVQANPGVADYGRWAEEVDLVANDHYTIGADPHREADLAFCADRSRGMAGGRPWLLIEHSTAAVNWQPVNRAKAPGEMARNTLAHIARGADGAMFFQWRQSTAGSEQFHSAMVPHAGADSQVYRDVVALGATLQSLAPVVGSRVERAQVAMLFDHEAAAAWASGPKPSSLVTAVDLPRAVHRALTELGIAVDVLRPGDALDGYRALVVPTLFLATDATADAVRDFAESGGHVLVTYLSGIVDETNRVRPGGYPGAFRDLLGVRVDEFFPLFAGDTVALDDGTTGSQWTERVEIADGTEVLARLADGDLAGTPAVTRRSAGAGSATYLATRLDHDGLVALVRAFAAHAGVTAVAAVDGPGMEVVRRVHDDGRSFLFAINHAASDRTVAATGRDLTDGTATEGRLGVPAGAVRVIEEDPR